MGGSFSQIFTSVYEGEAVQTKLALQEITPSERLCNMRVLALDPRSPSRAIDRTPIIVMRTPSLPCDGLKCSKSATDTSYIGPAIKDPRSPTIEFTRTPINPCHSSGNARQRIHSTPISHHVEEPDICEPNCVSMSPVTLTYMKFSGGPATSLQCLESAAIGSESSEVFSEKNTRFADDTEVSFDVDLPPLDDTKGNGCDEGYKGMEVSPSSMSNKILHREYIDVPVKSGDDVTPKLPAVISHNRIGMKPKVLTLTPAVTRSPLSAVENSPRLLLQRTVQHGGKAMRSRGLSLDKENVLH